MFLKCVACVAGLGAGLGAAPVHTTPSPFSACAAAESQWSYPELLCLYRVGAQHSRLAEARARLRRLGAGDAEHPWATLVLGHATLDDDEAGAIRHYEVAADGFVRAHEPEGEVIARQNLRNLYRRRGAVAAATRQVELALAAAEQSRAPLIIARASVVEAGHLLDTGGDVGRAHRVLLRAERLAFPGAPIGLRRAILFNLASATLYLGRFDDAIDALERHRALRQEDGSAVDAAMVAFNLLNARVTQSEARPSAAARARLLELAEDTLAEIRSSNGRSSEAQAHRLLADLLLPGNPDLAAMHLRRCLEIEAPLGHPELRARCLWSLSHYEAIRHPSRAEELSREAIQLISANRSGLLLAFAWQARLRLVWQVLPQAQATSESLEALDAIERLRASQQNEGSRAALFSGWTRDYYWLTGRLLDAQPVQLEKAFDVGERLRSRELLEHLTRAGVVPTEPSDRPAIGPQLARRIGETQRRLLTAGLTDTARRGLLDQLQLLELERAELVESDAPALHPTELPVASLGAVRQALDDGEAMLWFSMAPWKDLYDQFGGGSWVLVVTPQGVSVHRLSTRVELDSQVAALTGLLRQRDTPIAAWTPAAQYLGKTLLASAVRGLPTSVRRLVIASDGVLHRLPFEALRPDADPRTLGERFEVSMIPSATLWLHLRRAGALRSSGPALVLADPEVPRGSTVGGLRLDPLPWSRREAAAIVRNLRLGPNSIHQGSAASERLVKDASFHAYRVLHLAAHARADGAFPDRSAVFLAPGAADQDGWLQPREIAGLKLQGALVVLSACESAEGVLLSGEGPLSLARAFFAGGAGGVVATRWPLRDDDAAFMMERFYRALATGAPVRAALLRTRRDAIDAGYSAAVWAGVVLLGDGSRAPVPAHSRPASRWRTRLAVVVVILVATMGILRRRAAHRR